VSRILIEQVTKLYPGSELAAVNDLTLEIPGGEFMVLVGPSGCGKSTLLRMIAGLEDVSSGRILIGEEDVTEMPPRERDIAMVFQNYALYPHMTVRDNLAYGLKVRRTPKREIKSRVESTAKMLGIDGLLERRPGALSGGQRQRVAMGRAIVREAVAFLMDEPLSNLDAKLRVSMRGQLAQLHDRLGITTVYVTHDQIEAMTLGQRVTVMREGVIQQVGTPQQLYTKPINLFVAAFIGSPAMNLVDAVVDSNTVRFADYTIPLELETPPRVQGRVILGIRPESFTPSPDSGASVIDVTTLVVEDLGSAQNVIFPVNAPRIDSDSVRAAADDEETTLLADQEALFTATLESRNRVRPGEPLRLAVNSREFQFFDHESGLAIDLQSSP